MQDKQNTPTCMQKKIEKLKKIIKRKTQNRKIIFAWALGIATFLFAFLGLLNNNNNFFQAFYGTFAFFGGNADLETIKGSFLLSLSALLAPIAVAIAIVFIFFEGLKKFSFIFRKDDQHIVLIGLGNMGLRLANDILANHKDMQLVVIEVNKESPHVEELKSKGAIFVIGDASSQDVLDEARVESARKIICLTGDDLLNLEIAFKLAQILKQEQKATKEDSLHNKQKSNQNSEKEKQTLYIHLSNRENSELLMTKRFEGINIKSFSAYDNAAQTLFMKYPIGRNRNTIDRNNIVKLAIVGFDKVGESVAYRALNLGHFYNKQPIEITIFDENHELKKKEFEKLYPLVKDYDGVYWKVSFEDEAALYAYDSKLPFSQIVFCSKDNNNSYADATRLIRNNAERIMELETEIYLFADTHREIVVAIEEAKETKEAKELNVFKFLYAFGDLDSILSYDVIMNEKLDKMAIAAHDGYNELHPKYAKPWEDLSHFTKESNRMQVEHLQIKLKVINHFMQNSTCRGDYDLLKAEALKRWFKYDDESSMLWDIIDGAKTIVENVPLGALDRLAEIEHNRWNAFHILHGWRQLEPRDKDKFKDSVKKRHICLVDWDTLDYISEIYNRNYKSNDVEIVIRAKAMTDL